MMRCLRKMKGASTPFSLGAFLNPGGLQVEDTRTKEQFTKIIMWAAIMW